MVGLVVAFIFVTVMTGLFYQTTLSGLAPESGVVKLDGLTAPVKVIRDAAGIPHIYAQNRLDLARALGYTEAQDRLFQLEMRRRLAEGRLAEVFGADLVESDYVYRLFDPEEFARDSVAMYPPKMRAQVDAFVGGINAYIDAHQNSLEPAFRLVGIKPAHYTAEDLEAGALTIAVLLGYNATEESVYMNLAPKMAPGEIAALMPVYPSMPLEPPPPEITAVFGGAKMAFHLAPGFTRLGHMGMPASNNWVVDGTRTMSGKPMLANDPHLPQSMPSIWYEAVLVTPDGFTSGALAAGSPAIAIGTNGHVAWGVTSVCADVMDLSLEHLSPDGKSYEFQGKWLPLERREVTIHVRDAGDVTRTILSTRHGPIVSDVLARDGQSAKRREGARELRALDAICGADSRPVGGFGIRLGHRAHRKGAGRGLSHVRGDAAQSRLGRRFGKYRMENRGRDSESRRLRRQVPDAGIHREIRVERDDPVRQLAA